MKSAQTPPRAPTDAWAIERQRIEQSSYWVSPAGKRSRWRSRAFSRGLGILALGMRLAGLYGRGRRNALAPRLVELDLPFPLLPPAFDGYRILQVSDTHLDALPELGAIAGRMIAEIEVDLLALTGDVLGAHDASLEAAVEPLVDMLAGLAVHDRRLAVLGNHDPVAMAGALQKIGFEVLLNRSVSVERDGERLMITGLDDVHCFYTEAAQSALWGCYESEFRIALIHSPEIADLAAAAGIDLYLCGHTHGGQVCLPGGRALITHLTRCRNAARGLWRFGSMVGYTSSGLGTSWPQLRYNCPGEITLITLRRGNPSLPIMAAGENSERLSVRRRPARRSRSCPRSC
jgi:uncharacterized protein